jgi:hypothetical protein
MHLLERVANELGLESVKQLAIINRSDSKNEVHRPEPIKLLYSFSYVRFLKDPLFR